MPKTLRTPLVAEQQEHQEVDVENEDEEDEEEERSAEQEEESDSSSGSESSDSDSEHPQQQEQQEQQQQQGPPAGVVIGHRPNGTGLFPCPYANCEKAFARKYNLATHYATHFGVREWQCNDCGRRFTRRYDLTRHQGIRHSSRGDPGDGSAGSPAPAQRPCAGIQNASTPKGGTPIKRKAGSTPVRVTVPKRVTVNPYQTQYLQPSPKALAPVPPGVRRSTRIRRPSAVGTFQESAGSPSSASASVRTESSNDGEEAVPMDVDPPVAFTYSAAIPTAAPHGSSEEEDSPPRKISVRDLPSVNRISRGSNAPPSGQQSVAPSENRGMEGQRLQNGQVANDRVIPVVPSQGSQMPIVNWRVTNDGRRRSQSAQELTPPPSTSSRTSSVSSVTSFVGDGSKGGRDLTPSGHMITEVGASVQGQTAHHHHHQQPRRALVIPSPPGSAQFPSTSNSSNNTNTTTDALYPPLRLSLPASPSLEPIPNLQFSAPPSPMQLAAPRPVSVIPAVGQSGSAPAQRKSQTDQQQNWGQKDEEDLMAHLDRSERKQLQSELQDQNHRIHQHQQLLLQQQQQQQQLQQQQHEHEHEHEPHRDHRQGQQQQHQQKVVVVENEDERRAIAVAMLLEIPGRRESNLTGM
ncbi:hypothetical protein HKX48_002769 [Thoreauomyces humboldtii]|nr:hypothetical protein HKX48_002769 [Thoreauomyces humboldtii]